MAECSESGSVELLPLEKSKSPVWTYFGFLARGGEFVEKEKKKRQTVVCKLCNHGLSYSGNTTNMLVHLQYKHKDEYAEVVKAKPALILECHPDRQWRTVSARLRAPFNRRVLFCAVRHGGGH